MNQSTAKRLRKRFIQACKAFKTPPTKKEWRDVKKAYKRGLIKVPKK